MEPSNVAANFIAWRRQQPPSTYRRKPRAPSRPQLVSPFQLEAGIPLPPKKPRSKQRERLVWPFDKMRVGDSFLVTDPDLFPRATRACNTWQTNHPEWHLVARTVADGLRIWRVLVQDCGPIT